MRSHGSLDPSTMSGMRVARKTTWYQKGKRLQSFRWTGMKASSSTVPSSSGIRGLAGAIHPATAPAASEVSTPIDSRATNMPRVKLIVGSAAA